MNGSRFSSGLALWLPTMLAAAAMTTVLASSASAVFSVGTSNTVSNVVDDIPEFEVTGNDMSGMVVTVFYTNGSSESAVWAGSGGSAGAANGVGFELSIDGDTFSTSWSLVNNNPILVPDPIGITGFRINAEVGGVVFDIIESPNLTTGSEPGTPFATTNLVGANFDGRALYSHTISRGNPPENGAFQGDLYGILDVVITDAFLGPPALLGGFSFEFEADTDLMSQAVPEGSQILAMTLVGLISGGVWWKRRRVAVVG